MITTFYEIAGFVDTARLAEFHQVFCLIERDFFLKLIPTESIFTRWAFNSKISAVVTDTYPDGTSVTTADITLLNAAATESLPLVIIVTNQKFPFYLQAAH